MVTAIILAAGAGRRMGGEGKALLQVNGRSALERVVAISRAGGCRNIITVLRPGEIEVHCLADQLGTTILENPVPEEGMFSSVRRGLERVLSDPSPATGFLIYPVDHPFVRPETVQILLTALSRTSSLSWIQPIALDPEGARRLLEIPGPETLRNALRAANLDRIPVPVEDPGILRNLNTPQDLP
jgi:nicotine blue oxidoreductase